MRTELFRLRDVPANALSFWREWLRKANPTSRLTSSPEWFAMMSEADVPEALVAVVAADGGQVQAVLPLLSRSWTLNIRVGGRTLARKSLPILKICGGDLPQEGLAPAQLAETWARLAERFPASAAVWFEHLAPELTPLVQNSAESSGRFIHRPFPQLPHYYLALPTRWEEYLGMHSKSSHKRLNRYRRALEDELGAPLRMVEFRREADWAPYAERIERLINSSWQARELGHRLTLDSQLSAVRHGFMRSFLLLAGEHALAFQLAYQGNGVLSLQQTGYDQAFSKYGPGAILMQMMMQKVYEEEPPGFLDWGVGESEYKRRDANQSIRVDSLMLAAGGFRLRVWFLLAQAGLLVDGVGRRLYRRICEARKPVAGAAGPK